MLSSPLTIKHSQQDLLLVKDNLAAYFREEIISGRFAPGEKIVEVKWAKLLKISQTSVREALNILLEGYAARIVAEKKIPLGELEQSLSHMRSAIECHNLKAFYDRDLQFHLLLAEKTGNGMLVQALKRIILPLFAFVVIRVQGARTQDEQWIRSLEQHKRIIDALKTHDPVFAERLVTQTIGAFLEETKVVVESGQ